MKKLLILLVSLPFLSCQQQKEATTVGSIDRTDPALDQLIAPDAKAEVIAEGFEWSEGPVWVAAKNMLLFSDVPKNIVYKWTEKDGLQSYLTPSGYTGSIPRGGEPGANGLIINSAGQLVLCQHGDRRVAIMKSDLDNPRPEFETLAATYDGKKFSSPNDVIQDSKGNYFFTDPPYGLVKQAADSTKETPYNGVYKLTSTGKVFLLIDSLTRPNGIALSPDESRLYVANSDPDKIRWYRFDLADSSVTAGKVFFDASSAKDQKGLPDGLKVDRTGNIFASGPGGIWIFNPDGKQLGKINLPEAAANCGFSDDYKTLFITMDMSVLRMKLNQ